MQIQAPRAVLAEAAMDALFLSYADPELAAEVILGHFEASPHPNLSCMREDGSYNMVADDGQICGTAPEWGFPLWCCDTLLARTGEWSTQQDTMHLAPVFCEVSSLGQVDQLRPFLAQPPSHSHGWAPLSWPPVVMMLVGAASAARMPLDAAELAYRFIDASYRSIDRRELDEHGGLPGVTREYRQAVTSGKWGAIDDSNAGIEGYGWGALSIHLIMRYLMGVREEEADKITITPALPQAPRRVGATYRIAPIPWGTNVLGIECTVRDSSCLARDIPTYTSEHRVREYISKLLL